MQEKKKESSLLCLTTQKRMISKKYICFGRSFSLVFLLHHPSFELDLVHFLPFLYPPLSKKEKKSPLV